MTLALAFGLPKSVWTFTFAFIGTHKVREAASLRLAMGWKSKRTSAYIYEKDIYEGDKPVEVYAIEADSRALKPHTGAGINADQDIFVVKETKRSRSRSTSRVVDRRYSEMVFAEEGHSATNVVCQTCEHCVSCCDPNPVPHALKLKMEKKWALEAEAKLYQYFHLRKGGGQSQFGNSGIPKQMIIVTDDNGMDTEREDEDSTPNMRKSCRYIKEDFHSLDKRIHAREEKITIDILYRDPAECTPSVSMKLRERRGLTRLERIWVPLKSTNVALMAKIECIYNVEYQDANTSIHSSRDEFTELADGPFTLSGDIDAKKVVSHKRNLSWSWNSALETSAISSCLGRSVSTLSTSEPETVRSTLEDPMTKKRERKVEENRFEQAMQVSMAQHQGKDVMYNFNHICKQIKTTLKVF